MSILQVFATALSPRRTSVNFTGSLFKITNSKKLEFLLLTGYTIVGKQSPALWSHAKGLIKRFIAQRRIYGMYSFGERLNIAYVNTKGNAWL